MKYRGTNDAAIATNNPGGDNARDNGCRCNSFNNCHGYGCYGEFEIEPDCPVHGDNARPPESMALALLSALAMGASYPFRSRAKRSYNKERPCLNCKTPHSGNQPWCSAECCKAYKKPTPPTGEGEGR